MHDHVCSPRIHSVPREMLVNTHPANQATTSGHLADQRLQNITSFPTSSVYPEKLNYSLTSGDLQSLTMPAECYPGKGQHCPDTQPNVRIVSTNSTGTNCSPICPRQWPQRTVDFRSKKFRRSITTSRATTYLGRHPSWR